MNSDRIHQRRRCAAQRQARQRDRHAAGRIVVPVELDARRLEVLLAAHGLIDPDAPAERPQLRRGWQRFIDAVLHTPPSRVT